MGKILFVVFNIAFYVFNFLLVPYMPNFLVFGFMPFQLFLYLIGGPLVALIWGLYFRKFFATQNAFEGVEDENI